MGFPVQSCDENEVPHLVMQLGLTPAQEDHFDIINSMYTTTWDLRTTYTQYQSDCHEILMEEEKGEALNMLVGVPHEEFALHLEEIIDMMREL